MAERHAYNVEVACSSQAPPIAPPASPCVVAARRTGERPVFSAGLRLAPLAVTVIPRPLVGDRW